MKRIKDFKDWLAEGYYDPPEDPDPWMVQYEDLLVELEDKMEKEGMKVKNLWEDLMDAADVEEKKRRAEGKHFVATPGPDDQFSDDLDKFMGDKYHEMYTGKYNAEWDAEEATPEYTKVSKKAEKDFMKKNPQPSPSTGKGRTSWSDWSRKKSHYVEKELYRNVAEKNWNEYKNIYKKWQDYLHKIRGSLQGIKFGL